MQRTSRRYLLWLTAALAAVGLFHAYDSGLFSIAFARLRPVHFSESPTPTPLPTATTPGSPATALEFLGTGFTRGIGPGTDANTYFSFDDVATDCLPIYPVTIIWRAKPEHKTGYYTTFFWGNDGLFQWKDGTPDSYWGAHPYPDTGAGDFETHHWEIATDFGGDIIQTLAGTRKKLVTGSWFTQGFRAWRSLTGKKVHRFYIDLPSLNPDSIIEARIDSAFGNVDPPNPALVWGGAPWGRVYGNDETYRGLIRGIQIYNQVLTEEDMLQESRAPLSTAAGKESIWYMKLNPTVDDMLSDVEGGPHGGCAHEKRRPVLRIDQETVDLDDGEDRARIKVRSWAAP
jgi:hypothetical protein